VRDLARRSRETELLDAGVPAEEAHRSLADLRFVNRYLGDWSALRAALAPLLDGQAAPRVLDVGCGSAELASLLLARLAADGGDLSAASQHLDRIAGGRAPDALKAVARLQKARVLLAQGKLDEALAAASADAPPPFRPAFAEVRGDVLAARGDTATARQAYQEALQGLGETAPNRALVQMKLDDLGAGSETGGAGS